MLRLFTALMVLVSAPAWATDWSVNSADSKLGFFASQAGAEFEGGFKSFNSKIKFDPKALADSQVKIIIEIASVDTQSADRDANITNPDWFNTAEHPTATFETKLIEQKGEGEYIAKSDLTMRGITKEVSLPFSLNIDGNTAHAKGEVTVSRTEFGIDQGQWAASTVVADDVRIFFDLRADAQ